MFQLYSKGCQHTLRALLHIPHGDDKKKVSAKDICRKARIPEAYSRKMLQDLVSNGLLKAISGPGGGYVLARRPQDVTLFEVIAAVDGDNSFSSCVMGLPKCGHTRPCPMHASWLKAKEVLMAELKTRTLAELLNLTEK